MLLVDDHPLVRAGLRSLLETASDVEVIGEAADGREAVSAVADAAPQVVLMDLSMPRVDGVAATRRIAVEHPHSRVVVLTSFADHARVRDAVRAGAIGFVLKDATPDELLAAIRAAAEGHAPLDPRIAVALLPATDAGPALSDREVQVLRLVAKGLANKQIARSLGIAEQTVKIHLGHVFKRIGVADRTSAALWAQEHLPGREADGVRQPRGLRPGSS